MQILDLTQVPPAQWGEALNGALNAINAEKATVEAIQRDGQLRALKSREAQLQAELNDVRERLTYLQDSNYSRFPRQEQV